MFLYHVSTNSLSMHWCPSTRRNSNLGENIDKRHIIIMQNANVHLSPRPYSQLCRSMKQELANIWVSVPSPPQTGSKLYGHGIKQSSSVSAVESGLVSVWTATRIEATV